MRSTYPSIFRKDIPPMTHLAKEYDDKQQSDFIFLLLKMLEIHSFQIKLATDFFIKSKGYLTLDNALSKYIIESDALISEYVKTSMIVNQNRISIDNIYTLISRYSSEYYKSLAPLEALSNEYIFSNIKIEAAFSKLYMEMVSHDKIDYNLPEEIYQLKRSLQPNVSASVQKATRTLKNI